MTQLTDFLMIMGGWAFVLYVMVAIVNWLSAKFFTAWFRVRISQGGRWLVKIWTADNKAYYRVGTPDGNIVRYKDRGKNWRRVCMVPEAVYRSFGCDVLETDETQNGIRITAQELLDEEEGESPEQDSIKVRGGFRAVTGFDAKKMDNLVQWALTLPRTDDRKILILMVLSVLTLIGLIILGYLVLTGGSPAPVGGGTI